MFDLFVENKSKNGRLGYSQTKYDHHKFETLEDFKAFVSNRLNIYKYIYEKQLGRSVEKDMEKVKKADQLVTIMRRIDKACKMESPNFYTTRHKYSLEEK